MRLAILYILCLLCTATLVGQRAVSIGQGTDTLLIGQVYDVPLELTVPQSDIDYVDFSPWREIYNLLYDVDSTRAEKIFDAEMMGSEQLGIAKGQWKISGDQLKALNGSVQIALYTYGYARLSTPLVKLKNGRELAPTDSRVLIVDVPGGLEEQGMQIQLEELKDIIREPVSWRDYLGYAGIALGLLALVLLGRWLLSRKSAPVAAVVEEEPVEIIPAHIKAQASLEKLEAQQLWQSGEEKAYHSALTSIMRTYLDDRYELPAMELTTAQIQRGLQDLSLDGELTSQMVDLLQIADKVKFAKGITGDDINKAFMRMAYEWVAKTKLEGDSTAI